MISGRVVDFRTLISRTFDAAAAAARIHVSTWLPGWYTLARPVNINSLSIAAMPSSRTSDPPEQDSSYSTMSVGDVEAIGAHCQMPFCHQLDFLPFRCESCKGYAYKLDLLFLDTNNHQKVLSRPPQRNHTQLPTSRRLGPPSNRSPLWQSPWS